MANETYEDVYLELIEQVNTLSTEYPYIEDLANKLKENLEIIEGWYRIKCRHLRRAIRLVEEEILKHEISKEEFNKVRYGKREK